MLKSKFTKILLFIFLIWLAVTIYFYFQHQVTIQRHVLDNKVELENATVVVKEILLKDVKRKGIDFESWRFTFAAKLPISWYMPFVQICSFYSQPYEELPYDIIELRGKVILNEEIGEEESLWDYYDIKIVDEIGVHYGSGSTVAYEGSNIYYFAVRGNYYNRNLSNVDIIIKEKSSEGGKTIPVKLNWQAEKYNFFNRPPLNLQPSALGD